MLILVPSYGLYVFGVIGAKEGTKARKNPTCPGGTHALCISYTPSQHGPARPRPDHAEDPVPLESRRGQLVHAGINPSDGHSKQVAGGDQ